MTIKARTRHTLIFFIISLITFVLFLGMILYQLLTDTMFFPNVYFIKEPLKNIVTGYNDYVVLFSIFIDLLYVMICTFTIWRSFSKTQSSIIIFFLLYLIAVYFNTYRLFLLIFHISYAYSQLAFVIGNISLFSKIMAPLSLIFAAALHFDEQTPKINRYCLLLVFGSIFLTSIIPINTAKILPNFNVSHGYSRTLQITTITLAVLGTLSIFICNIKSERKQLITFGFLLICVGFILDFYLYSMLSKVIAYLCIGLGSGFYLDELHKDYLWN